MKKIPILTALTTIFLLGSAKIASATYIESLVPCGPTKNMCTLCDFVLMANNIFEFILKISLATAILFVAIAGILYIVSAGSEQLMTTAKSAMTYALMGFGFCLGAWLLVQVIASSLGYSNWHTIDIHCDHFLSKSALIAAEENCKNKGGTLNPKTGFCECTDPDTVKYEGRCVDKNLVSDIKDCDNGTNQEWNYDTNECNCKDGYNENDDKNCVSAYCWQCDSVRTFAPLGSNRWYCTPPCKKASGLVRGSGGSRIIENGCIPGDACGTISDIGALGRPCGTSDGSTCQATNCLYGKDNGAGGKLCNNGNHCCKVQPQIDPTECNRCSGYDIFIDITLGTNCTTRADGTNRLECVDSGGQCAPNSNVCP
ncbi:MAG: pilin [Patescibacteria group bacterium]|nr:pilin [Patescibacteria group bacterium]